MEKIVKRNGKVILVESPDGYFRHIKETVIGTYEEKEEKPKKSKGTKKGVDE